MTDRIEVLPAHIANQIAAGEVVQRPASAVKELIENAVDAGATRIDVHLVDAGRTLIQILDNGTGMSPADAVRCFERHATSKLRSADDLFTLLTKGFRGEALASIASVARVELRTQRPGDDLGTHVLIEGASPAAVTPAPCTPGTSIAVRDLFFNIPARRAFLKSDAVELRHCTDEFTRIALAHPDLAFTLTSNGTELFHLRPGSLRARILGLFGPRYDERLVPIDEATDVVSVTGFVGKPAFARRSRGEQFLFVNRRFVRHPALHRAICDGFVGLLPPEALPFYVLFLEVDPARVDVNIHPTKVEVKFDEERTIVALLRPAIRRGLGRFQVVPALDFDTEASITISPLLPGMEVREPSITVDATYNPFEIRNQGTGMRGEGRGTRDESRGMREEGRGMREEGRGWGTKTWNFGADWVSDPNPNPNPTPNPVTSRRYIVTPMASGILVVDPHRAHARVLYEELLERRGEVGQGTGPVVAQQLLYPEECAVPVGEREWLLGERERLMEWGVHVEAAPDGVRVLAVPAEAAASPAELVEALIGAGEVEEGVGGEGRWERLAGRLARARAVRPGAPMTAEAQADLVDRLFGCEVPGLDPFGRPTVVTFTADEIRERFR